MSRVGLLLVWIAALAAQETPPGAVIRINVNLVQVDAVVTDSKGHHVSNLKAEDFEILQDGKPQSITNFSYVTAGKPAMAAPIAAQPLPKNGPPAPPPPPAPIKAAEARRFFALLVDDLGLSFQSIALVRDALRQFVRHEMQPGDMVAIVRASGGMGVLQQFTTDHAMLETAIDRIKFRMGRVGVDSFVPAGQSTDANDVYPAAGPSLSADLSPSADATIAAVSGQVYLAGTLGALRYVIDGLREMPGRKSVVLFSESMQIFTGTQADPVPMFGGGPNLGPDDMIFNETRHLIDAANRSSVVIYTVDPRPLQPLFPGASDNPSMSLKGAAGGLMQSRAGQLFDSREGLFMLSDATGGLFKRDDNDLGAALREVVADTEGFYLIGYHPDADTFDPKTGERKFHDVKVRLKVAGLHVRSRAGFFGEQDTEKPLHSIFSAGLDLLRAATSPFASGNIKVRLTALFRQSNAAQPYLNGMLHIDAKDLQFATQANGTRKAELEVLAMTFGESGQPVDQSARRFVLELNPDQLATVQKQGLLYQILQPLKKPGLYQMRVALRDVTSGQLGSASQFISAPDVSKGRLTLSSILLAENRQPEASVLGANEGRLSAAALSASDRVFPAGAALSYQYSVFNARLDAAQKADLQVQTRIFRDGKLVYSGKPMVPEISSQPASKQLQAGGNMVLGAAIPPGDYVLQVIVTDKSAKQKLQTAWQWTDFSVQ